MNLLQKTGYGSVKTATTFLGIKGSFQKFKTEWFRRLFGFIKKSDITKSDDKK
jgi:hypothetical protein